MSVKNNNTSCISFTAKSLIFPEQMSFSVIFPEQRQTGFPRQAPPVHTFTGTPGGVHLSNFQTISNSFTLAKYEALSSNIETSSRNKINHEQV